MNKKLASVIILIFFIYVFSSPGIAQVENSIYSMFGIGQLIDNNFGINRSLGGTGIAFQSGSSINYLNPASYLGILPNSFILEAGVWGIQNKSVSKKTYQITNEINFSYFTANLYCTNWWASSFGIVPFSSVDYEIYSTDNIEGESTSIGKLYRGSGGLNRIYWGNSFRLFKGFSFGFNTSYIIGFINQTETAILNDANTKYELKNKRNANSVYLDYGFQYSVNKNDWLYTIGFIYGASKKLNTSDDLEFTYNEETSSLEQENQLDIKIPQKLGLGISLKKGENFRAGIDYEWGNWSNINFTNPNLETKNSNRFSIGMEYCPKTKKNDKWFNNLFYRFGANYKNSYLKIDDTPINSAGINIGIGIPYDNTSSINMSVEYGEEGTLNKGLIKNKYWTFYFNISLHEFWSNTIR